MKILLTVLFFLASATVLSASIIALVRPLPKVGLSSRKHAAKGFGVAFALFVMMVIVMPKPEGGDDETSREPAGTVAAADAQIVKVQVTEITSYASIQVDLKAGWSEKDMPSQAAMVIEDVGKVLKGGDSEIPQEIERINFWFTYPMINRYGEESRSKIFSITFKADDLRRIRYGKIPTNQVLDLGTDISFGGRLGREAAAAYCAEDGRSWSPVFCHEVITGRRY